MGDQIREKMERGIKHNEKDTFTPPFNGEKGEMGNSYLIESTLGGLSENFQITSKIC